MGRRSVKVSGHLIASVFERGIEACVPEEPIHNLTIEAAMYDPRNGGTLTLYVESPDFADAEKREEWAPLFRRANPYVSFNRKIDQR